MKANLQRKVNLMVQNAKVVRNSAKLDFVQAANLGALLFTSQNLVANERDIRAHRKMLKERTGVMNNLRGPAANLALLSRMSLVPDAESYLNQVILAYNCIKTTKIFRSETLTFTAMSMAENCPDGRYDEAARAAWETLDKMSEEHPLLTTQADLTMAYLLNLTGLDTDELLNQTEEIYDRLKPTGFKLKKDTLQSISFILALSDKPVDEKCARFMEIRDALRKSSRRIYGMELAVVAAFVEVDKPTSEIVADIAEAEDALKHNFGFGPMLCGGNLRRLYACALVLQVYAEEDRISGASVSTDVAQNVVQMVIFQIIMIIIMTTVVASSAASSSAS